ncbi:hypothetical protein LK07_32290 [Streptomyces pluripotens]|uniref:Uncharacterized protein n=1 Tax=Streptomyces pluripotens TaxID=1355015 RepID=A0A221P805_9ACTN|nr:MULTISPECIES: hypothetical protein [Streptomyces]ARP73677.1 hypothetical protein LK06_031090 [Streptomyces pluripotens]ASN27925.1 hypothetical protein LK07_32290 [Streptomyces pluripotens]KIE24363.1 hypothetical protein LK08_25160 [Streptomyces sp. MUSC 125]MCH0559469.1 hypothetical protein [Streptomyces sp. MUM 16J]
MLTDLSPLIAATSRWLTVAYPPCDGALAAALCETQVLQAVTVAAWLRYPTEADAALVTMTGPGGAAGLDLITGAGPVDGGSGEEQGWRTWVDEVVASWAAGLLTDPELAGRAVGALVDGEHTVGIPVDFRRLTAPDDGDLRAAALLRHPDLLAPVAEIHLDLLLDRLGPGRHLAA